MNHQQDVLTAAFLQSRGVAVAKPLRDWLTRVAFLARAQSSVERRERYERWALLTVEEALRAPGGVAGVAWAKQTTVMPHTAADCESVWWRESRRPPAVSCGSGDGSGSAAAAAASASAARAALLSETMQRAPAPLRPFVQQGFGLYDREVALGQRRYEQVTFVEMLNIARNLQAKAPPLYPAGPSHAPPLVVPSPMQPGFPVAPPRAEPTIPFSPTPVVVPTPRKHAAAASLAADMASDRTFFFQLAGITDAETAAPPELVGTSTELERHYTRYEPLVEDIRPVAVLRDAYAHIVRRAAELEAAEGKKSAHKYLSDQLKGMRQDLRVQNVVDNFTIMVYEVHARLCLETADIGEFNQCQAGLKQFYAVDGIDLTLCDVRNFFLYRLVYLTLSGQYDALSSELIHFTNAQLQGNDRVGSRIDKESVNRTLALCAACNNGDAPSLCRLLAGFETEMTHLVRIYLQKLRIMWLKEVLTAMKGSLELRFLMASLGFTPLAHGKKKRRQFWLDDSEESAALRFTELFQTVKVQLPSDFSFHVELARSTRTDAGASTPVPSLDAATAVKAVDEYLVFLGTRKDSTLR
ncbi:SAC3/GANP/Nin1/mts3/eIF-3 p25 family [Novymonas esmeraldas]|uniref:SAC3/GANP/Nin1/mts3/eIF-3 p25 family n=1 Tax=Novymonas esmeraldas TaxID=1808958 RepID=A0AAW0EX66_9TRYP